MKKQDIFETALALIVAQGLHATPMSQIAKEANVAAGTIYHYFSNKEEMIHELYRSIYEELEEQMKLEEVDLANYASEFSAYSLRIFKFFIQNPSKFHFLQQYKNSPMSLGSELLDQHLEYPIPRDFFEIGVTNEIIKPLPLGLITSLIYANITTMVRLQLSQKIQLNRELIQTVIDGCWNMIKQ